MATLTEAAGKQSVLFQKVWQQPYVDLFKQIGAFEGRFNSIMGDVKQIIVSIQYSTLHRKIVNS